MTGQAFGIPLQTRLHIRTMGLCILEHRIGLEDRCWHSYRGTMGNAKSSLYEVALQMAVQGYSCAIVRNNEEDLGS